MAAVHYMVFAKVSRTEHPRVMGIELPERTTMGWVPLTVYRAPTPEEACKAAAKRAQAMGSYCAIECTPWGVDLITTEGVAELGADSEADVAERAQLGAGAPLGTGPDGER